MPVVIRGLPTRKYRPAARTISNADLVALVPAFAERQAVGAITSRDLAERLNADGVPSPSGRPWSHSTIFRLLERAKRLGLPVVLRSKGEAQSARRRVRRSRDQIAADRLAERIALRAKADAKRARREGADPGITAFVSNSDGGISLCRS